MKKALIVIDLQNDFCPGGALAVDEGDMIVPIINSVAASFDLVAATRDWHPADHVSFASNHPDKKAQEIIELDGIEQVLWPDHCIQGSRGADFHPDFDVRPLDLIIHKGTDSSLDSYSAFFENDHRTPTGLAGFLKGLDVQELYFCGLATDYCVYYSVLDALGLGFQVYLIEDCVRGVGFPARSIEKRLKDMRDKGTRLLNSGDL